MKSRGTMIFVLLAYLAVTLVIGVVHHHEHHHVRGHDDDCAACVWQVVAATDAPVIFIAILFAVLWLTAHVVESAAIAHDFIPATASRAPPIVPA